ncbi:MAG: competence/damage-inducible protein A [bacterium]
MLAEIISVGSEIILGDVVDTNSKYIARKLTEIGYDIHYLTSVGDNRIRLEKTIKTAINRSDIVITTGGLGPTDDDLTKEIISEITHKKLELRTEILNKIKSFFNSRNFEMTENNKKQAYLPTEASEIINKIGTAPGFLLKERNTEIISLPGVPKEMKYMFDNEVFPYLKRKNNEIITSRILNVFSIGESRLETEIKDILDRQKNPTIALLAGKGEVKIRITAKGNEKDKVNKLIKEVELEIREKIGDCIYGTNDKGLEVVVGKLLKDKNLVLATAESCTGGLLGNRITNIPGSSAYYKGGFIVYSNQSKNKLLNVKKITLEKYGAVSEQTAEEMAENTRKLLNADIGISLTGIAGPGGGTQEKPVGLVYIGLSVKEDFTNVYKLNLRWDREGNKWMSSQYALYYIYKYLISKKDFN